MRAPDGWGVMTTCFKVQGTWRDHRIGDKTFRIGSQGMGSRITTDYLCPTCLGDPEIAGYYGIPPESRPAAPTPYFPGKRKLLMP